MILLWAIAATIVAAAALILLFFHAAGRGDDLLKIEQLELELTEYIHAANYWQQQAGNHVEKMRREGVL